MAELTGRAGDPPGRRRNRRQALEKNLKNARTPQQVLAAAAAYFRSVFAFLETTDEDRERAKYLARQLIELTDREAGDLR